jgi:hypothetical protein
MNDSEINIYVEAISGSNCDIKIDNVKFQKMLLLFNAVNDGWSIKKKNDNYIFSKNHEGKREILSDSYLLTFMKSNFDINKLLV